jgi:UDP-N-acetylglucosamine 2-epimerase (non-hydrolysing)/GDP/UDP-N,N'-diacetylbacillosamine 2-epimerase (hydrolysing)
VALTLRIPVAHIEGGEISEGAIDDAVRNALTKMAHIHFTSTDTARARVISMGEEPWRVTRAGAPSLDHITRSQLLTRSQLEQTLKIDLKQAPTVVAYHPVTLLQNTTEEADALFDALSRIKGQIIFCYPNADAGSHSLMQRTHEFIRKHTDAHVFVNLGAVTYWSLLKQAGLLLGNSSSGIMEAASFALPVVNVGLRQYGRERAPNVLDADPDVDSILDKIATAQSAAFRESLHGMTNPYGNGHAADRIVQVLTTAPLEGLLRKRTISVQS